MTLDHRPSRWVLPVLLVLGLTVSSAAAPKIDSPFEQAEKLRSARKFAEAGAIYQTVLSSPQLPMEEKIRCLLRIVDCDRQQKKLPEALAATDQLLTLLTPGGSAVRSATETRCDLLIQMNRREEAALYATECGARFPDDPDYAASWYQRSGHLWLDVKRPAEAAGQLSRAADLATKGGNLRRAADSLWTASEAMWNAKELDKSAAFAQQVSDLDSPDIPPDLRFWARNRIGDCLVRQERLTEARQTYQSFIATETTAEFRPRWWLATARLWQREKNAAATIDALDHVITGQAGMVGYGHWFEAQSMIADTLVQAGDLNAALQAARVCLDVADTRDRVNQSAVRISHLLQQIDKTPNRAKVFMAFQRGETPENPLDAPLAPPDPDRVKAFAQAQDHLGTDTEAMIQRGLMRAYLGQRKEAYAVLMEACRRAVGEEVGPAYGTLLFVGVRGVRGNAVDLDSFARYLAYGAAGADGKSSLPDPFAALQVPPPAVQAVVAQQQALAEVQRRLEVIVEDPNWPEEHRRDAVRALQRVHSALGDWGEAAVSQWYLDSMAREKDGLTQDLLLPAILSCSRQGQIHWGGTLQYLVNRDTLSPKLQKALETLTKRHQSPMLAVQQLEEQTRLTAIFRR